MPAKRKAALASVNRTRDNIAELAATSKKFKKKVGSKDGGMSTSADDVIGHDVWQFPAQGQADLDFLAALPEECMTRDSKSAVQQLVQMRDHKRRGEDLPFLPKGVTLRLPSSPFSGVGRKKRAGGVVWSASVSAKSTSINLGNFKDEIVAARAHDLAALLFCETSSYRKLNFQQWTYAKELQDMGLLSQDDALLHIKSLQCSKLDRTAAWCSGRKTAAAQPSLAHLVPSVLVKAISDSVRNTKASSSEDAASARQPAALTSQRTIRMLKGLNAAARLRAAVVPFDCLAAQSLRSLTAAGSIPRLDFEDSLGAVHSLIATAPSAPSKVDSADAPLAADENSGCLWPTSGKEASTGGDADMLDELAALVGEDLDTGSLSLAAGNHFSQGTHSSTGGANCSQTASNGHVRKQVQDACVALCAAAAGEPPATPQAWSKKCVSHVSGGPSHVSSLGTCTMLDVGQANGSLDLECPEIESPALHDLPKWSSPAQPGVPRFLWPPGALIESPRLNGIF